MTFKPHLPHVSELTRVIAGSFALYWLDKVFEVIHFHAPLFGLGEEATVYSIAATSALFSAVAGAVWLFGLLCMQALRHWHLRWKQRQKS